MKKFLEKVSLAEGIEIGGERPVLISGPCAIEDYDIAYEIAASLKDVCHRLNIEYIFKGSFDKANRTSISSFRTIGTEKALSILERLKSELNVPTLTDIHQPDQTSEVAAVVDVLQIPAFLCRQTDLLVSAGESGKAVNIKRGQFMAPEDMKYAVEKVRSAGNENVCLTERGVSFGYHNLVVDMRSIPIMRQYCPTIFDITHSLQQPGAVGGTSGGQSEFAPYLGRAAAAVGVDGFFIETHPDPSRALSDGPNMIALNEMEYFLGMIKSLWKLGKKFTV